MLTSSEHWAGSGIDVQASVDNPSGCLTLNWLTDAQGQGRGFAAAVTCRSVCQHIEPLITAGPGSLDSNGVWTIDLCAGQLFELQAGVAFPQNNIAYTQSPATTSYSWRRADESEHRGPTLLEAFRTGGAYAFELSATDARGCRSLPPQRIVARVSPRPRFALAASVRDSVCAPDALSFTLSNGGSSSVQVLPQTAYFPIITHQVDSLPLPDGTGAAHESSININHFAPDLQLTAADQLERVCATMEHSWLRDLSIDLIAPNGRHIELHDHPGRFGNKAYLGEPILRDNNLNPPRPGVGYEYCWTPAAANAPWLQHLRENPQLLTLPAGDYAPKQDFARLVNTPLNGEWRIRVKDHWESDNGWIFSWRLQFATSLPLRRDSFSTQILTQHWLPNPAQSSYAPLQIGYVPTVAGVVAPTLRVVDDFGCRYDTSFSVVVLPADAAACAPCASRNDTLAAIDAVEGDTVVFALQDYFGGAGRYQYAGTQLLTAATNPASRPLELQLPVTDPAIERLGSNGAGLLEVCLDIAAADAADLTLSLSTPSGKTALLASGDATGRPGFRQTCFRAEEGAALNSAEALTANTLRSKESWDAFNNASTAGLWTLSISDDRGLTDTTVVYGWSLTFHHQALPVTSQLAPQVFALPDGRLATVADTSQLFRFVRQSADGCRHEVLVPVRVRKPCQLSLIELGYQSPKCPQSSDGNLTVLGLGAQGPALYRLGAEVNFDGKFVAVPSGAWTCTATDSVGCAATLTGELPRADTAAVSIYTEVRTCEPPRYAVALDTVGSLPLAAVWWVDLPGQYVDFRDSLLPGSYRLRIADSRGCITYRAVDLPDFAPLAVQVLAKAPSCDGGGDGEVTLSVSGGTPAYEAFWHDVGLGLERKFLFAGAYAGFVEDRYGCRADFNVTVPAAEPMVLELTTLDADCSSNASGSLAVYARGGQPPLLYSVDAAPFQPEPFRYDLAVGQHRVVVQDAKFCESSDTFSIGSIGEALKPLLREDIDLPAEATAGDTLQLIGGHGVGAGQPVQWAYTETAWFGCDTCWATAFVPEESGVLTLTRGAGAACRRVERFQLLVKDRLEVIVPTGFMPESHNMTDRLLQVHGRSGTVIERFAVFDRWGALIYEDHDFRVNAPRGWDGTFGGRPAPAGLYLYEVEYRERSGAAGRTRGNVQLVR